MSGAVDIVQRRRLNSFLPDLTGPDSMRVGRKMRLPVQGCPERWLVRSLVGAVTWLPAMVTPQGL